jgi:hypothetical protein
MSANPINPVVAAVLEERKHFLQQGMKRLRRDPANKHLTFDQKKEMLLKSSNIDEVPLFIGKAHNKPKAK